MNIPFIDDESYILNNYNNKNNNKQFNLENGIIYKIKNDYKYFIYIPTFDFYMIKEIKNEYFQNVLDKINKWNENKNENYLKFYKILENKNQNYFSVLIEQSIGFTLTDIINSIGFIDNETLIKISEILISFIKRELNEKKFYEFCPCDIILDLNQKIKFIPPLLRNIHLSNNLCNCKITLLKLTKLFKIKINPFFCLGIIILKMISGNIKLSSFKFLFLNYEKMKNESQCCLFHTLLYIENKYLDHNELLLKDLLKLYPKDLNDFLCSCLSFKGNNYQNIFKHNWILGNTKTYQRIQLSFLEILKITESNYKENVFDSFEEFYDNFELIYNNIDQKLLKNYEEKFISKKNEIILLSKCYNIEKEVLLSKFINISRNNF